MRKFLQIFVKAISFIVTLELSLGDSQSNWLVYSSSGQYWLKLLQCRSGAQSQDGESVGIISHTITVASLYFYNVNKSAV